MLRMAGGCLRRFALQGGLDLRVARLTAADAGELGGVERFASPWSFSRVFPPRRDARVFGKAQSFGFACPECIVWVARAGALDDSSPLGSSAQAGVWCG